MLTPRWEKIRDEFVTKIEKIIANNSNRDENEIVEGGVLNKETIEQVKDIAVEVAAPKWGRI